MNKRTIKLDTVQKIEDFVREVSLIDYEVDLVQGRYSVNARSIMGIFSLDITSHITVVAHTDCADDFFNKLDKFA